MFNVSNVLRSGKAKLVAAASVIAASTSSALAAVPTEATDAIAGIGTDAGTLLTNSWPVVVSVTGGFILIKLVKRAMRSAS